MDYTDLEIINSEMASDAQNSYKLIALMREQLETASNERDATSAQNQQLVRILSRAATLVNSALRPSPDPAYSFSQREDFMISLLEILETAKLHTGKKSEASETRPKTQPPVLFSVPLPSAESARYKPGSLGFVSSQSPLPLLPPI